MRKILQVRLLEGTTLESLEDEVNELLEDLDADDVVKVESHVVRAEDGYPKTHITVWFKEEDESDS